MELVLIALLAWVLVGLAVAWLLGRASDVGRENGTQCMSDAELKGRVSYRFTELRNFSAHRTVR